jgi:glycosyltransferase involved in cell wall biosynthesis
MVVGVSDDASAYFVSRMPDTRITTIPNGVDTEIFNPSLRRGRTPGKRPVGGFTGRLEEGDGKGIPQLINIVRNFPIDFEFVGKDFGQYEEYCRQNHIFNIRFYPHRNDLRNFYAKWDVFVSRSPAEGFGLSIAEAVCCGIPTVSWNCGGVTRYLEHGKQILLADTEAGMAEAIMSVVEGKVQLNPADADLSAKTMAARYAELYRSLVEAKPDTSLAQTSANLNTPLAIDTRASCPEYLSTPASSAMMGICPSDWHGVRRSLTSFGCGCVAPDRAIWEMRQEKPRVVVFGCYTPQWENVLLYARRLGCKTVLTWHASYILNEFDHINREWMWHALDAYKKGLFDFVSTPHEGLAQTWTEFGIKTDFMPNLVEQIPAMGPKLPGVNIGILGSSQPWKNVECQVIAAKLVDGAVVHTQGLKHTQSLDVLGIQTVNHGHMKSDTEYMGLMSGMSVNMCCSLSETYSYFTAESLLCGTPIIGTPIIPILRKAPPELKKCICPYFEDPIAIKETIEEVLDDCGNVRKIGREFMIDLNEKNKVISKKIVQNWLS